jgi:uridine kinase
VKGDVLVIGEHHRRAADRLAGSIADRCLARGRRSVVSIAGESGSGKSETAVALSERLCESGLASIVLGLDDYFVLPPRDNDARRRSDRAWLGPHCEVRLDLLQANVDAAISGAALIEKPVVDYAANAVTVENVALDAVRVLIVEGTYVSLLRHLDWRVFIDRDYHETLEHRRRRNRGTEASDPFIEGVLEIEHKIIAGHKHLADFVLTRDFDVIAVE